MALYTRGVPVSVIEHGVERTLTAEMLAAGVLEQLGGLGGLQGPVGPAGPEGPEGPEGAAGAGLPTGGSTGQLLAKTDDADHVTSWVTAPASGGAAATAALRRLGTGSGEAAPGSNAVARVAHGATAGTARPTGYAMVIWVGSVEPTNRSAGDLWVRTA